MSEQSNSNSLTDLQATVLELIENNPEMSNSEIAAETGTHVPLVKNIRSKYDSSNEATSDAGTDESDGDTESAESGEDTEPAESDDRDTRTKVIDLLEDNPDLTNAEVAEEVGAHVALVRDIRAEHGSTGGSDTEADESTAEDDTDTADEPTAEDDTNESSDTEESDDRDTRTQVLDLLEDTPDLTNAEVAEEVGTHVALVRDIRAEHGLDGSAATEADESTAEDDTDTEADESTAKDDMDTADDTDESDDRDTRTKILDLLEDDSDLTNAEIAERTGKHVALVRDIRVEHGLDGSAATEADESTAEDDTDTADESTAEDDTNESSDTEESDDRDTRTKILDLLEDDPGLTNAEIAEEVGTHVALVRDIRAEHGTTEAAESVEQTDESATESDPDTDDETTDTRAAVIELLDDNPDLTNAEIAAEVGTHVALVRDIRSEHTVSEPVTTEPEESESDSTAEPSDTEPDSEASNAEPESVPEDSTSESEPETATEASQSEPDESVTSDDDTPDIEMDETGTEPSSENDTVTADEQGVASEPQAGYSDTQIVLIVFSVLLGIGFIALFL